MLFAPGFLAGVKRTGPGGVINGLIGPFDRRLPQEVWRAPTPVNPFALAAFLGDGRDAAVI